MELKVKFAVTNRIANTFHLQPLSGEAIGNAPFGVVIATPEAAKVFQAALDHNRELDVTFTLAEKR